MKYSVTCPKIPIHNREPVLGYDSNKNLAPPPQQKGSRISPKVFKKEHYLVTNTW